MRDLKSNPRTKVLEWPGPFNFSALGIEGAQAIQAPVLVFLNNDIAVLESGWLKTPGPPRRHAADCQSASRGIDPDSFALYRQERTYFVRRSAEKIRDDPYFHPALSLFSHEVALP